MEPSPLPTNDPQGEIHGALAAVLHGLPPVGKNSSNDGLKFKFRGIEAMVNALNPKLGEHGVVPVPHRTELLHWEAKQKGYAAIVKITYRLTARDGSWVQAEGLGEGHDFADKAVSKACTMAEKMMLGQTFCMAYEDDPDGDSVDVGSGQQENVRAERSTESTTAPPDPIKARRAKAITVVGALSKHQRSALRGLMGQNNLSSKIDELDEAGLDKLANLILEARKAPAEVVEAPA